MKLCIGEVLDKQAEIIKLQTDIIDRLAVALLQHGTLNDTELEMIQRAAKMQEEVGEK